MTDLIVHRTGELINTTSASAEQLKEFAIDVRERIATIDNPEELSQLEVVLVAVGRRLKQLGKDANEAERSRISTLLRIGELLGKGKVGRPEGEMSSNGDIFSKSQRQMRWTARLLADNKPIVESELAKDTPVSLSRVVKICQRKRSSDSETDLPMPNQTYSILYADPPWRYDFAHDDTRQIENQYGTMTLESIKKIAIPAAEDAVLFCWTTSPKLVEGLDVVQSWGFEYKTCMVWVKDKIGMGYYARQQHELLLIATRGSLPAPAPENRPSSVIHGERTQHSAKPDLVYELIENMYPEYNRQPGNTDFLELFSRRQRHGWDAWGNEA